MKLNFAWEYSVFSRGGLDKFLRPERGLIGREGWIERRIERERNEIVNIHRIFWVATSIISNTNFNISQSLSTTVTSVCQWDFPHNLSLLQVHSPPWILLALRMSTRVSVEYRSPVAINCSWCISPTFIIRTREIVRWLNSWFASCNIPLKNQNIFSIRFLR